MVKKSNESHSTGCCFIKLGLWTLLSLALVLAFCWWSFYHYDEDVALFFHQSTHFTIDLAKCALLSELFEPPLMIVVLVLTGLLHYSLKRGSPEYGYYRDASAVAFWTVFAAAFLTLVVKLLVGRYRPEMLFQNNLYGFVGFHASDSLMHSMPSGHTSRAFSVLLGLTAFSRGKAWPYAALILASCVGFSRLMLTQHYLSDVVMAAYMGIICFIWSKALLGHCKTSHHKKCHDTHATCSRS